MEEGDKCKFCGCKMKWVAGGQINAKEDTSYMKSKCGGCGVDFLIEKVWTTKVDRILEMDIRYRTQEEHLTLVKHFGGIRDYLLSMGAFKE